MSRALRKRDDELALVEVRNDVAALCSRFNPYANFAQ